MNGDDSSSDEVEIDIDELLDMDSEDERKRHVQVIFSSNFFMFISKVLWKFFFEENHLRKFEFYKKI